MTLVVCGVVAVAVSCSSGSGKSASAGAGETSPQKADFTQVTTGMFVDRSALPNSAAMEFTAPTVSKEPQGTTDPVDPPECGPIFW